MILLRYRFSLLPRAHYLNLCDFYAAKRTLCTKTNSDDDKNEQKSNHPPPNGPKDLTIGTSFEHIANKNKNSYLKMVEMFIDRDVRRRNHVEFIYAALRNMESFGVHRDIEIYKSLINVLPKGKYIPQNMFQAEFMHYPKQQQCIIDLLEQMEDNGVIPDYEMQDILVNIFGRRGHPVLKYWRMMYWMPKFKNASPWLLPNPVPNDALKLAKLAVERMCTVDLQSKITIFNTKDVESSIDDTWIVSGMSPEQSELLREHDTNVPLHIEGPFIIWLRDRPVSYFALRGDPPRNRPEQLNVDNDDISKLEFFKFGLTTPKSALAKIKSVHVQDDGTIFAVCATGTSTKDSLLSWIRLLEQNGNSILGTIPILFKFTSNVADQLVPSGS